MGRILRMAVGAMIVTTLSVVIAACGSSGSPTPTSATPTSGNPKGSASPATKAAAGNHAARLFVKGANLCTLIDTTAVNKALGFGFPAGGWDGHVCNWEVNGGKKGMTVSVYPGATASQVQQRLALNGTNGITATQVSVPGATAAVLMFQPIPRLPTGGGGVHASIFTAYSDGAIGISISAPTISKAQAIAAAVAVAG